MKAVIFAPFWQDSQHVGNHRLERFVRWTAEMGVQVVLVAAGARDESVAAAWGRLVTLRDPLGLPVGAVAPRASGPAAGGVGGASLVSMAYDAANWLLPPDPRVVWARRAGRHPLVLAEARGADWVLSSSPPESAHVGAWGLARRLGARLIVDMRDGWLDEPLRPLLKRSALQRLREGRLERRILQDAERIFVTSSVWRDLLAARLPGVAGKLTVLTNGYPAMPPSADAPGARLTLVHAGRFTGSSGERSAGRLLEPLLAGLASAGREGEIRLVGRLEPCDFAEVARLQPAFARAGWELSTLAPVPRDVLLAQLQSASGLLMLSASQAAIPSKWFEYLPAGRPVLALAPTGSAVWQHAEELEHVFRLDYARSADAPEVVARFLDAAGKERSYPPPEGFTEAVLREIFVSGVR